MYLAMWMPFNCWSPQKVIIIAFDIYYFFYCACLWFFITRFTLGACSQRQSDCSYIFIGKNAHYNVYAFNCWRQKKVIGAKMILIFFLYCACLLCSIPRSTFGASSQRQSCKSSSSMDDSPSWKIYGFLQKTSGKIPILQTGVRDNRFHCRPCSLWKPFDQMVLLHSRIYSLH